MQKEDIVVVYIPKCDLKIIRKTLKTLYLVCKSYGLTTLDQVLDDKHRNLKEIIIEFKDSGNDPSFVIHIISAIEHALFAENKHLVFIIDQVDIIMDEPDVYKNQILFVNNLLGRYNVIVSGSANNEVTHTL